MTEVHSFVFGEKDRSHELILSTMPTERVPRELWNLTDRPSEVHHGEHWSELFGCGLVSGGWALWRSFNDPRKRAGMVQTHVRFILDEDIPLISDLRFILESLPTNLVENPTVISLNINPVSDFMQIPVTQKVFAQLWADPERKLPIIFPMELDYLSVLCSLWKILWKGGRKSLLWRTGLGPEAFDIRSREMVVVTPEEFLPRWIGYPVVSSQNPILAPNNAMVSYLSGEPSTKIEAFVSAFEQISGASEDLVKIERSAEWLATLRGDTGSLSDYVALLRMIVFFAPAISEAVQLKKEVSEKIDSLIENAEPESILSMANLDLEPLNTSVDFTRSIRLWVGKKLNSWSMAVQSSFLKRAIDDAQSEWWRVAIVGGFTDLLSGSAQMATFFQSIWNVWLSNRDAVKSVFDILPIENSKCEQLVESCPTEISKELADEIKRFSVSRGWSSLNGVILCGSRPLEIAMEEQALFNPDPLIGLREIAKRFGLKKMVKAFINGKKQSALLYLVQLLKNEPQPLKEIDPRVSRWREIWLALYRLDFRIFEYVSEPRDVVRSLFECIKSGEMVEAELMHYLAEDDEGHLFDFPEYFAIIESFGPDTSNMFSKRTANIWLQKFVDSYVPTSCPPEFFFVEVRRLLGEIKLSYPKPRPDILGDLLEKFPDLDETSFMKWFQWFCRTESFTNSEAIKIGKIVKERGWLNVANAALALWRSKQQSEMLQIIVPMRSRFSFFERYSIPRNVDGVDMSKPEPVSIFYSYCHADESYRNELEKHLKILQRQGLVSSWHDRKIMPGSEWKDEIDANLEAADIILLLISADFINSDYCWSVELKQAMHRHDSGAAIVIPIILRECLSLEKY